MGGGGVGPDYIVMVGDGHPDNGVLRQWKEPAKFWQEAEFGEVRNYCVCIQRERDQKWLVVPLGMSEWRSGQSILS